MYRYNDIKKKVMSIYKYGLNVSNSYNVYEINDVILIFVNCHI